MTRTPAERLLSTLGLCARARKLVIGTPMVCEALRKSGRVPILAVLEASDTSDNTHSRLLSKCAHYRTPLYRIPADTADLGHAVGKSGAVAAVGVTDAQLLRALTPALPAPLPLPTPNEGNAAPDPAPDEA